MLVIIFIKDYGINGKRMVKELTMCKFIKKSNGIIYIF